ncbi:TonB-dependent receptor [Granulicella mallensis]|uniref:TonB-dependent receptor plug n=1 Tax=Granulicella mallensis (strain ATCC BAA-1857 / DSM 23137 / MP5ACTX8) TaxID=682795 RepID=G8NTK4_GRAMM|nr:TonB-dependent receptor [Granulicella mallensis]AEU35236.1 TonB-dependent receptor plug [Granulicella mallensis MP5ACTX8]
MSKNISIKAAINTFSVASAATKYASVRNILRLLCLAVLFLSASTVFSQEFTGRVTDPSGAAVSKAKVTVTNQDTGVAVTTATTGSGDYTVPYLRPGLYSLSAEAQGFSQEARTQITLQVGQTAVINFTLKVGSISETVTVQSDEALLAGSGDVGEVVENTRVTELPLNAGNAMTLATLSAGTSLYADPKYQRPFDDIQADLSINGGGAGNSQILLDGVSNEAAHGDAYNGTNGQIGYIPPTEAVGEFKIITNPYSAEFGRASGGVIDMTLKNGTNTVHGSVYEFARRTFLDANSWANNFSGNPKTSQRRDQYGAELDGPVVFPKLYNGRDKTFFLLQFENFTNTDPGTLIVSVPQPEWFNGDFSKLTYYDVASKSYKPEIIYDPLTLHDNGSGVLVRDPFPGNIIPASRINPVAQKILSFYPSPNLPSTAGLNTWVSNYQTPQPLVDVYRNVLAKIDQNISSKDRLTLRYGYWERSETQNYNGIPGAAAQGEYPHGERSNTFATDWVHTFTPNLLFDFRASVIVRGNIAETGPANFDITSLGLPPSLVSELGIFANHFPSIGANEFTTLGNSGGQLTIGNSLAMLPSVTWVKGKHTIHAGIDWRILQDSTRGVQGGMSLSTDRTWTQKIYNTGDPGSGNSIASFLLGTANSGSINISPNIFFSQHYYAPFVQDDWKVTPRLTLNLGIRYDLNEPPVDRHNRADYGFDTEVVNPVNSQIDQSALPNGPVKGGMTFVGVNGNPRAFYSATKTDVQPRFGFAFAVDDRTVLHGGFGVMYRNPNPGPNQYGFSSTTSYVGSNDGGKTPIPQSVSNPYPTVIQPTGSSLGYLTALGQGPYFINPHYRTPQFQTFSVGMQHRFLKNDTLEINYVGTRTYHNDSNDNINRIATTAYANCNILLGGDPSRCDSAAGSYVKNPFYQAPAFQGTGYYTASTIQAIQLTRPFPQFTDIQEYQLNNGRSWYNAMQATAMHQWNKTLTLHATYTWSKTMDSGGYADQIYRIPSRNIDSLDATHAVTLSGVWLLPVGRGQYFLGNMNRVLDEVIGGWEFGSLYVYRSGFPWQVNANSQNTLYLSNAWVPRQNDPSIANAIRGVKPCAAQYVQQSDNSYVLTPIQSNCGGNYNFIVNPRYAATQNNIYSGIRNPGTWDWDINLAKNFAIYGRLHLQLRLEAFNVPNHPIFAGSYDNGPLDAGFGTINKTSGQTNQPRQAQLGAKFLW